MEDIDDDIPARQSPRKDIPTRPWADLLPELVCTIGDRLGLIDLLSFRAVCKGWRSATSTSSAEIESAVGLEPSFLVHEEDDKFDFYYCPREMKMYSISIPELEKANCLASNFGWLLMFRQERGSGGSVSMFFFCPFSRARIDLAPFPHPDLSNHVAAFSAPPTSLDCILAVVNRCHDTKVEMHLLRRGDQSWTKGEESTSFVGKITGAIYIDDQCSFYFIDDEMNLLEFSIKTANWQAYRIVDNGDPNIERVPFSYRQEYFGSNNAYMKPRGGRLEDNVPISICGTSYRSTDYPVLVNNQSVRGAPAIAQPLKGIWLHPRVFRISSSFRF